MDSKTREILERFAQRLIDNNARSRTYFLGQLKSTDTIDLFQYTNMFKPNIHLSNSILKKSKISYPYVSITPNKIKELLMDYFSEIGLEVDLQDIQSFKNVFSKENCLKLNFTKEALGKQISKIISNVSDKDINSIYNSFVRSEIYNFNENLTLFCDKYNDILRQRYIALDTLNMSAKNLEKESARTELYIGYPFIEGTFFSGKVFRAPLLLFSVNIESTPNLNTIKFNDEVYINPVFMISYVVENKMPHQRFEFDISQESDLLKKTTKYLKDKLSLSIDLSKINKIVPFNSYSKTTYEEHHKLYPGEYKITNNAVIGIFPISSRSIYYDIKNIIENDDCNLLLKNFLSKRQKDTKVDEYFGQNEETETKEDKIEVIETNDISQKMIIRDSMSQNMVIQGPPGTGKSQTIVNIISSNIAKGKTVLVVSEKKTAIDVIYNRLDKLASFALIIRNIDSGKNDFYKQLGETLDRIKQITPDIENKRGKLLARNKIINRFFTFVNKYSDIIRKDYDGFTFDEIARSQKTSVDKEVYNKIKLLSKNYSSFHEVIDIVYKGEYLEGFNKIKEEIDNYKTYEIFHYDLKLIEKIKKVFTLDISKKSKKYLFNRVYYAMPIDDFNIPYKLLFRNYRLRREIKEKYNVVQKEILKLNLEMFTSSEEKREFYNDAELLEFVANNKLTKDEITSFYQRYLYDEVYKANKEVFKFVLGYQEEDRKVTKAISDKEEICLEDILGKMVSRILSESSNNRDVFEGIKELERLSNLQRKKSIPFVTQKNFSSLKTMYPVWLMTPNVASSILPVQGDIFDLVIFDEASQMFVENAAGVIYRAKRAIVAGDTKQLRPSSVFSTRYVEDEMVLDSTRMEKVNIAALEEESLLDYASHKFIQRNLRYHYRSEDKSLIEFSANAFYQNKLFFASTYKDSFEKPLEVIHANGIWKDNTNEAEAKVVCEKIIELLKVKKKEETIGVITFNEQQRKLISNLITKEAMTNQDENVRVLLNRELSRIDEDTMEDTSMFIKNIENVQGDERDIIIFSITYARNSLGVLNTNFGLLSMANGENRLNVAITRAKKKIIIVKSFYSYELMINERNPGPYFLKKYLEYAELVNNGNEEEKHLLLKRLYPLSEEEKKTQSTLFKDDLKDRLEKKLGSKFNITSNYEVGSFVFDLAIYKENKLLLCIKTDNSLLTESTFDHENDYYCDKYLLFRGWMFVRVFSAVYWKNPNSEVRRIVEMIKK